jgi:hypothetical protein
MFFCPRPFTIKKERASKKANTLNNNQECQYLQTKRFEKENLKYLVLLGL